MRNHLLILLTEHSTLIDWAIFDESGHITEFATEVTLETLTTAKIGIIVLIPSTQLTITQVAIPSKRWQQIIQAVPYALEEQLAEEVDNLHFAVGKRESHVNFVTVAVIARAVLDAYQQAFKTVNLTPTLLTPDVLAVPKPVNGWGIIYVKNKVLVRTDVQSGFSIEIESLTVILQAVLLSAHPPEQLVIFRDNLPTPDLLEILQSFDIPIVEQIHEQGVLGWFTQELSRHKPLNLLQGNYQPTSKLIELWRPWRLTALLLLIWMLLFFAEQGVDYHQLLLQQQQLSTQIEQIYRQTFPEARRIVDPRAQMEQQLKQLQAQQNREQSTENFLAFFQPLSVSFRQVDGLTIKQLDYQAGRFEIQLTAVNSQKLEQLKKQLNNSGLNADVHVASSQQGVVDSQLRVWKEK